MKKAGMPEAKIVTTITRARSCGGDKAVVEGVAAGSGGPSDAPENEWRPVDQCAAISSQVQAGQP